ncbi:MAG TPA: hypothetical protein VH142_08875 [Polyangiaceae bacterium]|nr:hypothetical protein [Polyangiaceae bacterium]
MNTLVVPRLAWAGACFLSFVAGCSSNNGSGSPNGGGTGAAGVIGSGGGFGAGGSTTPLGGGGTMTGTGAGGFGGIVVSSGGSPSGSGGGIVVGSGGLPSGGSGGVPDTSSGGGPSGGAPSGGDAGTATTTCTLPTPVGPTVFGNFPSADPTKNGPFTAVTVNNTGPMGTYTLYGPSDLTTGGPLFPVITWGNGTGTMPSTYSFLLTRLATHGFIVIASNSENVAQGTPPPMLDGVTWVFQQNCDPTSPLYHHVDTAHVGATGHSQGAFATMTAGQDPRIVATAPIEGSLPAQLHGPTLLLCGGQDTTVGCMGAQSAFGAISNVPVMYAELLAASHTSWITDSITASFTGGAESPFVDVVTAWMRITLMNDTSLKPMFYGTDCTLCKDTADWTVMQKGL